MQQYCVPKARLHICICGDDTEQCGHVGVNHATALGNASHSDLLAQNLCLRTAVTLLASLPQILKCRVLSMTLPLASALSLQAV